MSEHDNASPVAVDELFSVENGETLTVAAPGVMRRDSDVDGDELSVTGVTDDVDHGALAVFADGRFTYTPDPGFAGLDAFTYQITDGLETATATVTLEVGEAGEPEPSGSGVALISGLGGSAGFGENLLERNDDGSTDEISITSVFEDGVNFFGREFDSLWVNNNGSVTFNGPRSTFTPDVITEDSDNPEITPYFADVDTGGGTASPTPGGNSTGSNLVYYDFDTVNDRFIVTWDDVGYYSSQIDKLNAFQLILLDQGGGDFDIEFRYEAVNWTTGDASGGEDGFGGEVARAGYTAGTGDPDAFFELPQSGDQDAMLALDETPGNTGDSGRWQFSVRSGDIVSADIPPLPTEGIFGWTSGDPHLSTLDGVGYDFQAAGEFVLLRGVSDPSFEIQARMTPVNESVSVNAAVATNLGGTAVMIDGQDDQPLHVGGAAATIENFSSIGVGDDRIYREDDTYTILFAGADGVVNSGDSRLIVDVRDGRVDIDIRMHTEMAGDLEGLLGDGDGDPSNDIALADGTPLPRPLNPADLYLQYRDDWRVSDPADSLFVYDSGESLDGFYLPDMPAQIVSLDDLDPDTRAAAEQAARDAGLLEGTVNFRNAVLDFALTGDSSFLDSAAATPSLDEADGVSTEDIPEDQTGTPGDDLFFGDGGPNAFSGGPGTDRLLGRGGEDSLEGGADNDILDGGGGDDTIRSGSGVDDISTGAGSDMILGTPADLFGDTYRDVSSQDALLFEGVSFARGDVELAVTPGSAILDIDTDGDGAADGTVEFSGDYTGGDFMAVGDSGNTLVSFETFLPVLEEMQAVDPELVNGIINQNFLKGDGTTDFQVTLRDLGFAGYDNVLGVYEIDAAGTIVDTRILFENANADKSASTLIEDVEDEHNLGFFIVQDAAEWAETLGAGVTLGFVNSSGGAANISDGADISIAVNGAAVDEFVFHSFDENMNFDGLQHALSGVEIGGEAITIGFEDLTGGGDRDYEDVAFRVELVGDLLLA